MITAGIGRFGPYIKHGSTYKSLTAEDDVLTIGANRAVVLLAEPAAERRRGSPQPLRELGTHPDGGVVALFQGRYGPYVSHDGVFASLPREANPDVFRWNRRSRCLRSAARANPGVKVNPQNAAQQRPPRNPRRASRQQLQRPHLPRTGLPRRLKRRSRKGETARGDKGEAGCILKNDPAKKKAAAGPSGKKIAAWRGHSAGLNGAPAAYFT